MNEQDINNLNSKHSAKVEVVEWMITRLLSDEQLPEEALDGVRSYLANEKDEQLKKEMDLVFLAALQSGRSNAAEKSPLVEKMWPQIAATLNMDPNMDTYRAASDSNKKSQSKKEALPLCDNVKVPVVVEKLPRRLSLGAALLRVAAVLLPLLMLGGGYYFWSFTQVSLPSKGTPMVAFVATNPVDVKTNSVRHVTLPDGTRVTLNRNSIFIYTGNREGRLVGEAYFNVAKDSENPFVIHSDKLKVTVLGTEFNLNTQAKIQSTLSLYKGRVQVDYALGTEYLNIPGCKFALDRTTKLASVSKFNSKVQPEWAEEPEPIAEPVVEELLVNVIPLGEILDLIEREYGVIVVNRDAVDLNRRYNFISDETATVEQVMDALQFAGDEFDYQIDGGVITLGNNNDR
ncbi:MAG: FecR family protein [Prevotellaceae bacterium]|jgi:ferric-dicitrate binding protein FerR (iron transport regulator)|nr:FecR family protein [Prevotellaceae bacterium]